MSYRSARSVHKMLLNILEKTFLTAGIIIFALVIAANTLEIFSRTILDFSFYWVQEFTVIFCGYMIFFGVVVLFKRKANIFIMLMVKTLPQKAQNGIKVVNDIMMSAFLVLAIFSTKNYLAIVYGGATQTLKVPIFLAYMPIMVGFCGILMVVLDWFLEDLEHFISKGGR
jgi:TRAP-type C4-dicarboxylate transport system permease small subunit